MRTNIRWKNLILPILVVFLSGCDFQIFAKPSPAPSDVPPATRTVPSTPSGTSTRTLTLTKPFTLAPRPTESATSTFTPGAPGAFKSYSTNADFDLGIGEHAGHDGNPDELALRTAYESFHVIWVPITTADRVEKIDVNTGLVLGSYRTVPPGSTGNPAKVAMDYNGGVWVANGGNGSLTHIGLLENNQCVDKNNNGMIETSIGPTDVRSWSGNTALAAADECILHYVPLPATGFRSIAVNKDNNVWAGRTGMLVLADGNTGAQMKTLVDPQIAGCCGEDLLMDRNEVLWATGPYSLVRYDTKTSVSNAKTFAAGSYFGICLDDQGNVWNTFLQENKLRKFSPAGTFLAEYSFPGGGGARSCAVDSRGNVWFARYSYDPTGTPPPANTTVGRLSADGAFIGDVAVDADPTGMSVDENGKIWVASYSGRSVSRIDPDAGPINGGGIPVGAVDLNVKLPGNPQAGGDMTGHNHRLVPDRGKWTVVFDSEMDLARWGTIGWTGNACGDGKLKVSVASSNNGFNYGSPVEVTNPGTFSVPGGRYVRITVEFIRSGAGDTPVLYDLTIGTEGYALPALPPAPAIVCK